MQKLEKCFSDISNIFAAKWFCGHNISNYPLFSIKSTAIFILIFLSIQVISAQPIPVELVKTEEGNWQLVRGGQPYYIMGAAGNGSKELLADAGGNTFRTWGVGPDLKQQLDQAQQLGLTVVVGHCPVPHTDVDAQHGDITCNPGDVIEHIVGNQSGAHHPEDHDPGEEQEAGASCNRGKNEDHRGSLAEPQAASSEHAVGCAQGGLMQQ